MASVEEKDKQIQADDENEEEEEIVYEEVPNPHVIETGDSIKVKQVLDDATMAAIVDDGFVANYSWDNFKMLLMFVSCLFACTAQFFPMPFPKSRPLLAVCCAFYFIVSTVLQFIVTFIDKDTIMFTKACEKCKDELRIRASFPRYQEYYNVIVQLKNSPNPEMTTGKFYVGKYFTAKGEFDEVWATNFNNS